VIDPALHQMPDEEFDRLTDHGGRLAQSVRGLVAAVIRSAVSSDELDAVRREVEALTARLQAEEVSGSVGIQANSAGQLRAWGNPVIGIRNALAPPIKVELDGKGGVWAECVLGGQYEGPPGHVHGGISSLLLDHVLGEGAHAAGRSGMTASLTLTYRKAVPLGPVRLEAELAPADQQPAEPYKAVMHGRLLGGPDLHLCVEAEGFFVLPKWARDRQAADEVS